MIDNRKISELTVGELQDLIKSTVQKSVAEVMIEFAMVADIEAQIAYEAEMNDLVRREMKSYTMSPLNLTDTKQVDD
jgi:adenine C2-methylase RlmN of 23S rRNA A2503 and tRNA A37